MVFTSMTFHHFTDRALAASECRRVLRPGGVLLVRTGTREQIDSYAYVPLIPVTRGLHEEVLPSLAEIRGVFESAGMRHVSSGSHHADDRADVAGVCREIGRGRRLGPRARHRHGTRSRIGARSAATRRRWIRERSRSRLICWSFEVPAN